MHGTIQLDTETRNPFMCYRVVPGALRDEYMMFFWPSGTYYPPVGAVGCLTFSTDSEDPWLPWHVNPEATCDQYSFFSRNTSDNNTQSCPSRFQWNSSCPSKRWMSANLFWRACHDTIRIPTRSRLKDTLGGEDPNTSVRVLQVYYGQSIVVPSINCPQSRQRTSQEEKYQD